MDPVEQPEELKNLSYIEKQIIAQVFPGFLYIESKVQRTSD